MDKELEVKFQIFLTLLNAAAMKDELSSPEMHVVDELANKANQIFDRLDQTQRRWFEGIWGQL